MSTWPAECERDGKQIALLANQLGLDAVCFGWVAFQVKSLSRELRFRELVIALSAVHQEKELLVKSELRAIRDRVLGDPA